MDQRFSPIKTNTQIKQIKIHIRNDHVSNTQNETFKSNVSLCNFYPNLATAIFMDKMRKSPHLKRAPFKYRKRKFSSQIDHFVIVTQLCSKLSYTQNEQGDTF